MSVQRLSGDIDGSLGREPRADLLPAAHGQPSKIAAIQKDQTGVRPICPQPVWSLLTSHGLALLYLAAHPDATVMETAAATDLTDRRITSIIRDLAEAGLLSVSRQGRRNHYAVLPEARFQHRLVANTPIKALVSIWQPERALRQDEASEARK